MSKKIALIKLYTVLSNDGCGLWLSDLDFFKTHGSVPPLGRESSHGLYKFCLLYTSWEAGGTTLQALFRLGFPSAPRLKRLTLLHTYARRTILQKVPYLSLIHIWEHVGPGASGPASSQAGALCGLLHGHTRRNPHMRPPRADQCDRSARILRLQHASG